ncbi:C-terminal binding protein [Anaerobacillus isosaccharinicus]|uniref:C-terminal binding protein n=1 Tax=Anaerobacillus isosaccharinicus TaxID=1532552 RepID=A0A1S2KUZ1_9BACI|nr:C-terminal binding protein [Anaerobacillus isosaccharinicus]MBA5588075.1 C-terminal binding protein [Anaerobacillus isosaccharinicus]QOY33786.1 C-terminal binding protein [Anaerobacillus isosaccharinicus]
MSRTKVIITDLDHDNIHIETKLFQDYSIPFELKQCKTEDELINECQGATAFAIQYAPITKKVIESLPDLRLVVRYGVGVNTVDLEAATAYGVQICNIPDYGTHEVADHALAMMLSLTRKITQMNNLIRNGIWDYQKSIPVFRHSEQIIGVIGLGRIGTAFAQKAHSLGCKVIGFDLNKKQNNRSKFVEMVSFQELIEQSDVISIHCPLETAEDLINEQQLMSMKSTAYLINVSRGGIVNEKALDKALSEGWIAGAAVDVAKTEPIAVESPLLKHDNFLCTPHMGWYSEQSAKELKRKVAEEVIRFLQNEKVHYPVNTPNGDIIQKRNKGGFGL